MQEWHVESVTEQRNEKQRNEMKDSCLECRIWNTGIIVRKGLIKEKIIKLIINTLHNNNSTVAIFLTFRMCWWRRIFHFRRCTFCLWCSYFIRGPTHGDDGRLNKCFSRWLARCLELPPKPGIGVDVLVPVKSTAVGKFSSVSLLLFPCSRQLSYESFQRNQFLHSSSIIPLNRTGRTLLVWVCGSTARLLPISK
jgi:hypothetical protein